MGRVRSAAARAIFVLHALRYLWALPASLVGLLLALPALATGATARRIEGALEIAGRPIDRAIVRLPAGMRFSAITFGHVIIGRDHAALARCRCHERIHVLQYERWGVLLLVLYPLSSLVQLLRGRHPYRDNAFEREAFQRSGR
jgi:hypothetical protein